MNLLVYVLTPFVLALVVFALRERLDSRRQGWLLAAGMAVICGLLLLRVPDVTTQGALSFRLEWMPQIGLNLSFYLDGLALLFAVLVSGIAVAVMFYGGYYFEDSRQSGAFFGLMMAFTGSMLALVMAGNLLTLFIAWEGTSVVSFLLIGFKGKDTEARRGASQALLVTAGGGLALLVGLLLVGSVTGSLEFAEILNSGDLLRQSSLYSGFTILILLGCFAKSAQFPLHFWLPEAMSAPTPASAFLHSATMVKAGIYLLARFYPVLGNTDLWTMALTGIGLITLFIGTFLALRQRDLKGMLAFSTIGQLGALVALIGQPEAEGIKAAMLGIVAHALYKCTLFLVVGAVDHATGTRNIDELGGLIGPMRGFGVATLVAGLSMAGVPPLLGFVAKETLIDSFMTHPVALGIVILSAAFTVTAAIRLFAEVFLGKMPKAYPQEQHKNHDAHHPLGDDAYDYSHTHSLSPLMVAGPGVLAVLSLIVGLGVGPLLTPLIEPAVGKTVHLHLLPPEGLNVVFLISLIALGLGAAVFAARHIWLGWRLPAVPTGPQAYQATVRQVERFADLLLRSQRGKIRYYLVVILATVAVLLGRAMVGTDLLSGQRLGISITSAADLLKGLLLILTLGTTLASILFKRHLLAALSLGVAGYAQGGIFLLEPAPDVALVQFLVETLSTVLIIVILARTREDERLKAMGAVWRQSRRGLLRDIVIAVALGGLVGLFALAAVDSRPTRKPITVWHLENALPKLGVNDVVAGIVTDFRGSDTLIEITVFSMASLGVLTLLARPNPGRTLRLFRSREKYEAESALALKDALQEDAERPDSLLYRSRVADPIIQIAAILALPLALLIALAHWLYAGAAPGDGFTAGVICGLGVALWFVVFGYTEAKRRLRWLHPAPMVGLGLAIAFLNAIVPLAFGSPFLATTKFAGLDFADIHLASTTFFELGIGLAVFGGISAILEAISHPKEVEPL